MSEDPEQGKNIVDTLRMQDMAESLGDGLRDVIEAYLEDTPRVVQEMRAAYESGSWDEVQRLAHSLKSSSGIFGAGGVVRLARSLETAAGEQDDRAEELVMEISRAFEELRAVLNLYL